MKSLGIVRAVDELGRIVIPIETRKILSLNSKDPVEILTDQNDGAQVIVLRKFKRGCIFCCTLENTIEFKGKTVCKACIREMPV